AAIRAKVPAAAHGATVSRAAMARAHPARDLRRQDEDHLCASMGFPTSVWTARLVWRTPSSTTSRHHGSMKPSQRLRPPAFRSLLAHSCYGDAEERGVQVTTIQPKSEGR